MGSKMFLGKHLFWVKKILRVKIFWVKNFWTQNFFEGLIFFNSNFFISTVHIASFMYLPVHKIGCVYTRIKKINDSTHSQKYVLASTYF